MSTRQKHPIASAKKRLVAWALARPRALAAGIMLATLVLGGVLVWFLIFSGLNEPVQFIYSAF